MNYNKNGIHCTFHNDKKRSFYVDEDLNVLPCCFYARQQIIPTYKDYEFDNETNQNPGWNNLANHTLEQIQQNRIYKHHIFTKGWNSDNPSDICYYMCGHGRNNPSMAKKVLNDD